MYIVTITYNFDSDTVVKSCKTEEDAIKLLNKLLDEEIKTVQTENNYTPSVLRWEDDDVTLVYAEGYTTKDMNRNYALEDCANYRVFAVDDI